MSSTPKNAKEIYLAACQLPPERRAAFIQEACGLDGGLLEEINSLLKAAANATADGFLAEAKLLSPNADAARAVVNAMFADQPVFDNQRSVASPQDVPSEVGTVIGPYTLIKRIGEGGMGVVYRATQEKPFKREVALKIIKPGMDSAAVIARFEGERQALAMMSHPNIAKVLDAGTTHSESKGGGRPYFVMELIAGESLTAFCDNRRLSIPARLQLFKEVCDAVQHAHTKAVIHRDLKPSNILVTVDDKESPRPVVIDFGVAKALQGRLAEAALTTERGAFIGTLPYMSPEQVDRAESQIDTRSDVYSLGALLYELLVGVVPFDFGTLLAAGEKAIRKVIREDDPPKPSTRFSALAADIDGGAVAIQAAEFRRTRPAELATTLRRELEWIPLKALRKDSSRRYQSASELATDIENYLCHRPLIAGPETRGYRFSKFVSRNKGAVGAAALVLIALLIGLAGTTWGVIWALQERDVAIRARDETKQVADFQDRLLAHIDPTTAGVLLTEDITNRYASALERQRVPQSDRDEQVDEFHQKWLKVNATDVAMTLIDDAILKPAVKAVEKFRDQPIVDAQLRQTLADRYRELGMYTAALPLQERALDIRRRFLGNEHPDTLSSIRAMGKLISSQKRPGEAETYFREVLEKRRAILGEEHRDTLTSIHDLGGVLIAEGKDIEAMSYFDEALVKCRRVLGEDDPQTLAVMVSVSAGLGGRDKRDEAEILDRTVLEKRRRILGEEHLDTLRSLNAIAFALKNQGNLADAESHFRKILENTRRVRGEHHPETLAALNNLGLVLVDQGKREEAESTLRDALRINRYVLGNDHQTTLIALFGLGRLLSENGKPAEAEPLFREALKNSERGLDREHPAKLVFVISLGIALRDQGKLDEAEPYLQQAMDRSERILGAESPDHLISKIHMASLRVAQGKPAAAISTLAPAENLIRTRFSKQNPKAVAIFLSTIGKARTAMQEFQSAEANLLEAQAIFATLRPDAPRQTVACLQGLADLYTAWDTAEPGKGYNGKAVDWRTKVKPAN